VNWYTVTYTTGTGRSQTEWLEGPDAGTIAAETRYTLERLYNLRPAVMVRRAMYKEWNHYNRTISGELIR
jgi:hypothetical protein